MEVIFVIFEEGCFPLDDGEYVNYKWSVCALPMVCEYGMGIKYGMEMWLFCGYGMVFGHGDRVPPPTRPPEHR